MDLATKALIVGSWLGALLFVVRYARVRWRATPAGVNVMAFMAVIALVLSLAVLAIWWPDMPGRPWLRLVSWAGIAAVIWHRNWVFGYEQRQGRLRDNRSTTEDTGQHGT